MGMSVSYAPEPVDPIQNPNQVLHQLERIIGAGINQIGVWAASDNIQIDSDVVLKDRESKLQELTVAVSVVGDRQH